MRKRSNKKPADWAWSDAEAEKVLVSGLVQNYLDTEHQELLKSLAQRAHETIKSVRGSMAPEYLKWMLETEVSRG